MRSQLAEDLQIVCRFAKDWTGVHKIGHVYKILGLRSEACKSLPIGHVWVSSEERAWDCVQRLYKELRSEACIQKVGTAFRGLGMYASQAKQKQTIISVYKRLRLCSEIGHVQVLSNERPEGCSSVQGIGQGHVSSEAKAEDWAHVCFISVSHLQMLVVCNCCHYHKVYHHLVIVLPCGGTL